jgi:hypothetical protein
MFLTVTLATVGLTAAGFAGVAAAGEQLSKKQFLKEANAACKEMYKAIDANFEEHFAGFEADEQPSPAQIEVGIAGAVEIFHAAATDIEALEGPAALEQKVDKFLEQFNTVVEEFDADPQSAFAEELIGYPFAKPDKVARRIGLKECVQRG